ncbi:MAG TPA: zinc-dependent alcohol dehydrogenase family protein [Candidatus Limiplasma sp.]|nr:zinc-dependent alcohol dehydrogenase family protein [Candidatus Limiplasma sp.]HRX09483.1 zinc-dependent alcohol dehydrogenase family protein [Candidatus Limiplasma sp.]
MKAAVFYGKGDIRVEADYPTPEIRPNEVLIQVKACGVCGTDLHIFAGAEGATDCNPPVILGHEFSGVVTKVGQSVTRVKVGQHVTVNPNVSCESCEQCRRGNPHFCDEMAATGVNFDGGFAQYCKVLEKQVFVVPDFVSFEEAALCEPVSCCLHGIDLCNIKCGDTVMIVGGGTIGMIMLQLAQLNGAVRTVLLETNENRFALAKELGADLALNPLKDDVAARLAESGFHDIQVVIECAGRLDAIESAIRYAGKAATVMIFSLTDPKGSISYYPFEAFKKELTLKTSFVNPNTQGRAAQIITSGKLKLAPLISDRIALADIQEAFKPGIRNGKTVILP